MSSYDRLMKLNCALHARKRDSHLRLYGTYTQTHIELYIHIYIYIYVCVYKYTFKINDICDWIYLHIRLTCQFEVR